jgi:hypothetical protein
MKSASRIPICQSRSTRDKYHELERIDILKVLGARRAERLMRRAVAITRCRAAL